MKKLIALLAIIGFVPYAYAGEGADLSVNGEYRLTYTNDMNADFDDDGVDSPDQEWHSRTRFGVTARAGEKMTFHSTLVHNSLFGANSDQIPGGDTSRNADPSADEQNTLIVNEAYGTWQINDSLGLKFGRGTATLGDGRVVSSNDWDPVMRAFDGAMLSWDHEMVRVSGFGVWGATGMENNTIGRFYGIAADFKTLPAWLKTAHLHHIMVKRDAGTYDVGGTALGVGKEDTARTGFVVAGDTMNIDYRATYAMYSGDLEMGATDEVDATMMDIEVGYTLPAIMNMRFSLNHHSDSGSSGADNETYTGFHYDTHNNAGLMDVVGFGNLTYTKVGFSISPAEDLSVMLDYYMFSQTENDDSSYGIDGSAIAATAAANNDSDELGNEIDLSVAKKYGSNFSILGAYRIFQPGDAFKATAASATDDYTQIYLEGKLTF